MRGQAKGASKSAFYTRDFRAGRVVHPSLSLFFTLRFLIPFLSWLAVTCSMVVVTLVVAAVPRARSPRRESTRAEYKSGRKVYGQGASEPRPSAPAPPNYRNRAPSAGVGGNVEKDRARYLIVPAASHARASSCLTLYIPSSLSAPPHTHPTRRPARTTATGTLLSRARRLVLSFNSVRCSGRRLSFI
jgi:hypothetical protein